MDFCKLKRINLKKNIILNKLTNKPSHSLTKLFSNPKNKRQRSPLQTRQTQNLKPTKTAHSPLPQFFPKRRSIQIMEKQTKNNNRVTRKEIKSNKTNVKQQNK